MGPVGRGPELGERFRVEREFLAHVGWCSVIVDTVSGRRIVVAGARHVERAEARAARENAAARKERGVR